jgi:glycosyltransferase involved in cell wall biosynthesis
VLNTKVENKLDLSIIIPVFNGELHIENCLKIILKQAFVGTYEVIVINDASTDNSLEILEKFKNLNLKIFSLKSNLGQSAARNTGIKMARGEYIFFIDIDDSIENNTLNILFNKANEMNYDFVCTDFKRIENFINQRDGKYNYSQDRLFKNNDIILAMHNELHDPTLGHLGLFGCNGRLIKRSIITKNNIFFEEKLRWLEDKTFCWDVLSHVKEAFYIHQQLYSYYVYPNIKTAITESLINGFSFDYIKIINKHIRNSLMQRNASNEEKEKLCQQGLIFYSIQVLVSISRSMLLGKIELKQAKKIRRVLINEMFADKDLKKAIKNYTVSEKESPWIPKAIALRSKLVLEFLCDLRAKQVVKRRRIGKE